MHKPRIRIDVDTDDAGNVVVDVWSLEETTEDGSSGTWRQEEHLLISPPKIIEKLAPGELDPRD